MIISKAGVLIYYVNPFCSSVNPAADTKLSQSGDVSSSQNSSVIANLTSGTVARASVQPDKRISLKLMTNYYLLV